MQAMRQRYQISSNFAYSTAKLVDTPDGFDRRVGNNGCRSCKINRQNCQPLAKVIMQFPREATALASCARMSLPLSSRRSSPVGSCATIRARALTTARRNSREAMNLILWVMMKSLSLNLARNPVQPHMVQRSQTYDDVQASDSIGAVAKVVIEAVVKIAIRVWSSPAPLLRYAL